MAHVEEHLQLSELEGRYRSASEATEARHFQVIWLLAKGHTVREVSEMTSFGQRWLEQLLSRYNKLGPSSLGDRRRSNGSEATILKPEVLAVLKERLKKPPADGGLWSGPKVAAWMAGELGLETVAPQRGWEALKAVEWSLQVPRPNNPGAASEEERQAFKKKLHRLVAEEAERHPGTPIEVFASDEHRLGLKPLARRCWAPRGMRPVALGHHRFKWALRHRPRLADQRSGPIQEKWRRPTPFALLLPRI